MSGWLGDGSEFLEFVIGGREAFEHLVALDDGLLHPNTSDVEWLLSLFFILHMKRL